MTFCSQIRASSTTTRPRVIADRGYDHDNKYCRELWARGVKPVIARRGTAHGSGLGRWRWVVERTLAWLHSFRRLRISWQRDPVIQTAFLPRMRRHLLALPHRLLKPVLSVGAAEPSGFCEAGVQWLEDASGFRLFARARPAGAQPRVGRASSSVG